MKKIKLILFIGIILNIISCKDYLDIVPDNVATLDYAFRMRTEALKYLYTCYSFLPDLAKRQNNPALFGADEMSLPYVYEDASQMIGRGFQNANDPYNDYWNGSNSASDLWIAVSQCNIFLDHIEQVPDMDEDRKSVV